MHIIKATFSTDESNINTRYHVIPRIYNLNRCLSQISISNALLYVNILKIGERKQKHVHRTFNIDNNNSTPQDSPFNMTVCKLLSIDLNNQINKLQTLYKLIIFQNTRLAVTPQRKTLKKMASADMA